jgi:hypothetical protein
MVPLKERYTSSIPGEPKQLLITTEPFSLVASNAIQHKTLQPNKRQPAGQKQRKVMDYWRKR